MRARWWIWRHPFKSAAIRRHLEKERSMYVEVITTITAKVPVTDDGLGTPTYHCDINHEGDLPQGLVYAVVLGAVRSTARSIEATVPYLADES